MNKVVSFFSILAVTEEQGVVKRMLSVCTEFERIAGVVLEKSDKGSASRKRRGSRVNLEANPPSASPQIGQKRRAPVTPQSNNAPSPNNIFTPGFSGEINSQAFNPEFQVMSPSLASLNIPLDFPSANGNGLTNMTTPSEGLNGLTPNMTQLESDTIMSPSNMGSFQQPFVPQELWTMPMTLEWDWPQMAGISPDDFNAFENAEIQGQPGPQMGGGRGGPNVDGHDQR